MAEQNDTKVGGGNTSTSDFVSSGGYRQDVSRSMSNLIGEDENDSFSSKEDGYERDDPPLTTAALEKPSAHASSRSTFSKDRGATKNIFIVVSMKVTYQR